MRRRKFLFAASATALSSTILNACGSEAPSDTTNSGSAKTESTPPVNVNPADAPEVNAAKLGFIALTDAAALIIAKEKGFFDRFGMTGVEVVKQKSWGATRDNLELGASSGGIDGGHMLNTLPYLLSLGKITKGNKKLPMYLLARLHVNGQCISVAEAHRDAKVQLDASVLKEKIDKAKATNNPLTVADTFPGGSHWAWIRYWLAAGGINPDTDVKSISVPPPQMVANMKVGNMDAFCVSEPWHLQLLNQKIGYTACIVGEIFKDHPDKCFALRADFVDKHPKATKAILKAIQEAQIWCDKPENVDEMCQILSKSEWVSAPIADIVDRSKGTYNYGDERPVVQNSPFTMKYWRDNASFPFKSHDKWFLTEYRRWGVNGTDWDYDIVDQVTRTDIWKECAKAIGQAAAIPKSDSRGVETFFDGIQFDPEDPEAYLNSLKIKKV
jgi:nitrate/nitrite transport system substrate-binding protein